MRFQVFLVFLILGATISANAQDTPIIEDVMGKRLYEGATDLEFLYGKEDVGLYSGVLNLSYRDIHLPGANGLDLEFFRHYRTKISSDYSNSINSLWNMNAHYATYNPALTWRAFSSSSLFTLEPLVSVYFPDGKIREFYGDGELVLGSTAVPEVMFSLDYWKLEPLGGDYKNGIVVYSPLEAKKYIYATHQRYKLSNSGHPETNVISIKETNYPECTKAQIDYNYCSGDLVLLLSRIEDGFGNHIDYNYEQSGGSQKKLTSITSSDQRSIHVHWEDGLIKRVTSSDGQSVDYSWVLTFEGYKLKSAAFPQGYDANYTYYPTGHAAGGYGGNALRLKEISFSTGLKNTYSYYGWTSRSGELGEYGFLSIIERTDSTTGSVTTINYDIDNTNREIVKEQGADYCNLHQFVPYRDNINHQWWYKYTNYNGHLLSNKSVVGMNWIIGQQVRLAKFDNPDCSGTPSFEVLNEWAPHKVLDGRTADLIWVFERWMPAQGWDWFRYKFYDLQHFIPVLSKQTTLIDSVPFIQEWSDFNEFGRPREMVEHGTETRKKRYTYFSDVGDSGNWIVSKPKDQFTIDPESNVVVGWEKQEFTPKGKLSASDSMGVKREFFYYPDGNLQKVRTLKDSVGGAQEIEYADYLYGVPRLEKYAQDIEIKRDVNTTGLVSWEEDGEGNRTSYEYDSLKRLSAIHLPIHNPIRIAWPSLNLKTVTRGQKQEAYQYDAFGNVLLYQKSTIDGSLPTIAVRTTYDHKQRPTFESFPSANLSESKGYSYKFDNLDRIVEVTNTATNAKRRNYYSPSIANSLLLGEELIEFGFVQQSETGHLHAFNFQAFGDPSVKELSSIALNSSFDQNNKRIFNVTEIDRDLNGNIKSVQQGGVTRTHVYRSDFPNFLDSVYHPESGWTRYTYDNMGNRLTAQVGNQPIHQYIYDDLNRLVGRSFSGSYNDVVNKYDKRGRLTEVLSEDFKWVYQYDKNGNLLNEQLSDNLSGKVFGFDRIYDSNDSLKSLSYPNGETVEFLPDPFGRATTVGGYAKNAQYHADDTIANFEYGNMRRKTVNQNAAKLPEQILVNGDVMNTSYLYDELSSITGIKNNVNSLYNIALDYDGMNRLVKASGFWGSGSISYDAVGNILSKRLGSQSLEYEYDYRNRLETVSGSKNYAFSYDGRGNVSHNGYSGFAYDNDSKLVNVTGTSSLKYEYDGHNRRVLTKRDGIAEKYSVYSFGGQLLYEEDLRRGRTLSYFYLGSELVARKDVCADFDSDGDGLPNCYEIRSGFDPQDDSDGGVDNDRDGLSNLEEYVVGTNPKNNDTDNDGMPDGFEVNNNLNPFDDDANVDDDIDGLSNFQEFIAGTNPKNNDTDGDGIPDASDPDPLFNVAVLIPIMHNLLY